MALFPSYRNLHIRAGYFPTLADRHSLVSTLECMSIKETCLKCYSVWSFNFENIFFFKEQYVNPEAHSAMLRLLGLYDVCYLF